MRNCLYSVLVACSIVLVATGCKAKTQKYRVEVVREYPHDVTSYTQGLFFDGDRLYESTGQWGESTFRIVDLETGDALRRLDFDEKYFVEGSVIFGGRLYILTWTDKVVFVYDPETLDYLETLPYPREGWGLTTDGKFLIASDGSSRLFFMDGNLHFDHSVSVKLDGRPVRYLNELEYIDGKVWANVYTTDTIVIINPKSGEVEATVDCTGLLPRKLRDSRTDVLNGIVQNPADGKIYLTGKYWPRMYEVRLVPQK